MGCIWATYLELAWGVFAARHVVNQMTKWATQYLRHSISDRLTSTMTRLTSPRRIGPETPLREAPLSPSAPISIHGQSGTQQPIIPKTPLSNDKSTRDLSSDLQNANAGLARTPLSDHGESSAVQDTLAHIFSSNVRHKNKANEAATFASKSPFPTKTPRIPWETIVPIHIPFSKTPILEKTRETTGTAQICGLVSSMPDGPSSEKLQSHAFTLMESAMQEKGPSCHQKSSPDRSRVGGTTTESESFVHDGQRTISRSANEPSSRKEGSGAIPSPQKINAQTTPTYSVFDPDDDDTSPVSRKLSEGQGILQEEKQTLPPESDSVEWTAGRPDLLGSRGFRYHDYRIHRKMMWSWTSVMFGRLGARAEDADGSICSEDTSDSEYVPSELSDSEREDESEAASDSAQEEVWESRSEEYSHRTRRVGSDSQSEYGISEYQDDGERSESGNDSSEYWESEDEYDGTQDDSEYGSSDLWDDEVDCDTVQTSSEGEQNAYEDNVDAGTEGSTHAGDENDRSFSNTGRNSRRHHSQHGSLLRGTDLESLRSMALSTLCGIEFAELPLIQSAIQAMPESNLKMLTVALWCHCEFKPTASEIRGTLVRDINRCSALKRGEEKDTPRADPADFTFEELRCSPFKEKLTLWFADKDSDVDVHRRICKNLIRLTEAPYCARVLKYDGLENSCEFWNRLGEEALRYVYDCKVPQVPVFG
jgi:hypothetical protein